MVIEHGPSQEVDRPIEGSFGNDGGNDDFFMGDVSSIMIKPDMINDNIANDWDRRSAFLQHHVCYIEQLLLDVDD